MAARFRQVWVFQAYVAASVLTPALSVAQSSGPTATRTLARQSLMQAERAVAVAVIKAGTAGGLGGALAEDALLLYEGAPIVSGRDQAHRLLSSQASLARLRVRRMHSS